MHKAVHSSTTHDSVNAEKAWGLGGVGDITLGFLFSLHPEDTAIGSGGREVSQPYQQDSTQCSNHQVPETAGGKGWVDGWAASKDRVGGKGRKERSEGGKKKLCLYLLGYSKWQLLSSSMHNWVESLLVGRDKCRFCPTAQCQRWNIDTLELHYKSLCNDCRWHLESIISERKAQKRWLLYGSELNDVILITVLKIALLWLYNLSLPLTRFPHSQPAGYFGGCVPNGVNGVWNCKPRCPDW